MANCAAKVRVTPAGEVKLVPGNSETAFGPVEIGWYDDHVEITAIGAGRATITRGHPRADGQDVVVEIRVPRLVEVEEAVPGAD